MKTKLYILLSIALFCFQYSYGKTLLSTYKAINDTIILKSEVNIIEDTILLENMLAVRLTTTHRDSLLITDTMMINKKRTITHSRVLRETLAIDTIPVLQQASGMAIIKETQQNIIVAKQKKRKVLERIRVISPPTPQTSYKETQAAVAKMNKKRGKERKSQPRTKPTNHRQIKPKKRIAYGITLSQPIERPVMSHYSMLKNIRQKRIDEALGLYPVRVSINATKPETGVSSAANMDAINTGEPATGVSPAYAKMGVKKPLKSYEVLVTNFFEEAAQVSDSYVKEVYILDGVDKMHQNTNFMSASEKRVYTQTTPMKEQTFPVSKSYAVEHHRVILDKAEAYRRMVRQISHKRMQLAEQYEQLETDEIKHSVVAKAVTYVEKMIGGQLVHYWYGKKFDASQMIETPGEEKITAVNFPFTLFQQLGWTVNVNALAQKTNLEQLSYFFDTALLTDCANRMAIRKYLLEKGIGLYIAVIDEEMVFLYNDDVDQYVIYVTPYKKPTVVREYLQTVPLLDEFANAQIGKLADDPNWIKQWLTMDEVVTH